MNTSRTLSIIIPYIVLAAVFAALASAASAGFATAGESSALAAAKQLACSGAFYAYNWGAAGLYAPLLQPVYMAAVALGAGTQGVFYLMRVLFVGLSFVVALVGYRILASRTHQLSALLASVAFLLAAGLLRDVFGVFGIALDAAYLALVLRCCIIDQLAADNGQATGYARVLVPVLAGLMGFVALLFSAWAALVLLLVFAASLARAAAAKDSTRLMQQAWVAAGFILGVAVYLIAVLGFAEPPQLFAALASAMVASVQEPLACTDPVQLACAAGLAMVVLAVLALKSSLAARHMHALATRASSIASALLGIAALALAVAMLGPQLVRVYHEPQIEYGPAQELHCSQDELCAYSDAYVTVRDSASAGSVFVGGQGSNMWMYLLFEGVRDDNTPDWQLIVAPLAGDTAADNMQIAGYGMVDAAATCQLYKRAHEIGAISQG